MDLVVKRAAGRISKGSKSFSAAAALLPRRERDSVFLLYSWCRHCDDVIDDEELGLSSGGLVCGVPKHRLDDLKRGTLSALVGRASEVEYAGLQRVVADHAIPARYPMELLDGMAMDVAGYQYVSIDDTLKYCYHVAGVVGVMSAIVLGVRDRPTLERASDLGIAFQLTNIARDVVADAERGRIYLPKHWLDEYNLHPSCLTSLDRREDLARVVFRLLSVADDYYQSADGGINRLSWRGAWAVATARRVYRGIGLRVRQLGPASWNERVATSTRHKLAAGVIAALEIVALKRNNAETARSRAGLWTPEALIA